MSIFTFGACVLEILEKKMCIPVSWYIFWYFLPVASGSICRSLICFESLFVQNRWQGSSFCLLQFPGGPVFPAPFHEEADLSNTFTFGAFVKKQLAVTIWAHFLSPLLVPYFFYAKNYSLYSSFVVYVEVGCWNTSCLFVITQDDSVYLVFMVPNEFWECFF